MKGGSANSSPRYHSKVNDSNSDLIKFKQSIVKHTFPNVLLAFHDAFIFVVVSFCYKFCLLSDVLFSGLTFHVVHIYLHFLWIEFFNFFFVFLLQFASFLTSLSLKSPLHFIHSFLNFIGVFLRVLCFNFGWVFGSQRCFNLFVVNLKLTFVFFILFTNIVHLFT